MNKVIIAVVILLHINLCTAQLQKAEKLFKKNDYLAAASLYEDLYKKSESKEYLKKLVLAYYNTLNFEQGLEKSQLLFEDITDENTIEREYYFLHLHFLSIAKNYKEAIAYRNKYYSILGLKTIEEEEALSHIDQWRIDDGLNSIQEVNFNSESSDFSAIRKLDKIYFVSDREQTKYSNKYKWTQRPFLDIFSIEVDSVGKGIDKPISFSDVLNTKFHEGSFCFDNQGTTIYFTQSEQRKGKLVLSSSRQNRVKLYRSKKNKMGVWSSAIMLPFCNDSANYEHPSLNKEGTRLYFASDRSDSLGNFDIYYVDIDSIGNFGSVKNAGNRINTINREQFPFISEEDNLYFSSNGHLGLGMLDIFVSSINEDGSFDKPENLKTPFNSAYDDFSFSLSGEMNGFFSSNRNANNDNIYAFKKTQTNQKYLATISFKDKEQEQYLRDTNVEILDEGGTVILSKTYIEDGNLVIELEKGSYKINASSPSYVPAVFKFDVSKKQNDFTFFLEISSEIKEIIKGKQPVSQDVVRSLIRDKTEPKILARAGKLYFELPRIHFEFNQSRLTEYSQGILDKLIDKLKKYPSLEITVNSHTDLNGSKAFNQQLSDRRAKTTSDYLINTGGIAAERISAVGHGMMKPIVDCETNKCTKEMHLKNRRSEFEITSF